MRAVEEQFGGDIARGGDPLEQALPDASPGPSLVAVVDGGGRPVLGRHVTPPPARLQDVQDAADHTAIVNARLAWSAAGQVRLDDGPCRIRQPEQARHADLPTRANSIRRVERKIEQLVI